MVVQLCFSSSGVGPIHLVTYIMTADIYKTLGWPSQSSDLNPIENYWKIVKDGGAKKKPQNKKDLWEVVKAAWYAIPVATCQKLVNSMPERLSAV